jgi:hypothetical protein
MIGEIGRFLLSHATTEAYVPRNVLHNMHIDMPKSPRPTKK